jgi:hypothetical protein
VKSGQGPTEARGLDAQQVFKLRDEDVNSRGRGESAYQGLREVDGNKAKPQQPQNQLGGKERRRQKDKDKQGRE